jgi:hypothetical protein
MVPRNDCSRLRSIIPDQERTQRVDSIKRVIDEQIKRTIAAQSGAGAPQLKMDVSVVPDSEFPSFWPPVQQGSVIADLEGNLWILPTTSTNAANGLTYDVVNRNGEIIERVQLPKDHVLAGFGPRDVVYLTKTDGKNTYLERATLTGPPKGS